MKYLAIVLVLVLAFAFSCASIETKGRPITKDQMSQLAIGETKADRVTQIFGQPEKKEMGNMGEEKYIYSYYKLIPHWWTKDEVQQQKLEVTVQDGVVTKYNLRGDEVGPTSKD